MATESDIAPQQPLYRYPLKPAAWNERDVLLFANSIGCTASELRYVYELHPNFRPFPTFPIILTFKHDYQSTTSFEEHFTRHLVPPPGSLAKFPGFPRLDITRVVDGERTLEILQDIPPTSSGRHFRIQSAVVGLWDKGSGKSTIVQTEHILIEKHTSSSQDGVFTRMTETAIFMGQGGWGGPNDASPAILPARPISAPPTASHSYQIPATAHLLYRLNGDYNPLHATHVSGAMIRPTPIMHGLYTWNCAARAIFTSFSSSDIQPCAMTLCSFRARFSRPVRPGDMLVTDMWLSERSYGGRDDGKGYVEISFMCKVGETVVLTDGLAIMCNSQDSDKSRL